ncbi:uncharacterized protein TRIREDRAFT_104750 [Trichoderma reesei QM6a]|uniref:Predicted protein n=2 Tax=Hypocrea jecorina TaxID=51453 RepID=G0RDP3_HYPJQ|nr:uncharacterized protein TRIREDRAFT_104750 [Trichoderma reesei QM6a]EGR50813.1 predicted protein [Trichoderma reesei QM6a]ETS01746.1 hypothetical protein M419DRAFT_79962 [Trichoderma reesei RUT C-30]
MDANATGGAGEVGESLSVLESMTLEYHDSFSKSAERDPTAREEEKEKQRRLYGGLARPRIGDPRSVNGWLNGHSFRMTQSTVALQLQLAASIGPSPGAEPLQRWQVHYREVRWVQHGVVRRWCRCIPAEVCTGPVKSTTSDFFSICICLFFVNHASTDEANEAHMLLVGSRGEECCCMCRQHHQKNERST